MPKYIFLALVLASLALATVSSVAAAKPEGNTRPGWGHGDKNHIHTGPPGRSPVVTP